jgi:hypothetical protein
MRKWYTAETDAQMDGKITNELFVFISERDAVFDKPKS